MFVEASVMRGKGDLVLTGQLGDVMKESAERRSPTQIARRPARIHEEAFAGTDVHVHVPAGAHPEGRALGGRDDGDRPRVGAVRRPVRHDLAMTGEITLRGRVLPIGGVKEKVLGAVRAGITTIVLPKENAADWRICPRTCACRWRCTSWKIWTKS